MSEQASTFPPDGAGTTREERLGRYFTPIPRKPDYTSKYVALGFGCAGVGLAVLIGVWAAAQGAGASGLCCAIPFFAAGVAGVIVGLTGYLGLKSRYDKAYAAAFPKPPDAEVDFYLHADLANLSGVALRRLSLVESDVTGGAGQGTPEMQRIVAIGPRARSMRGLDGQPRFSRYEVMLVFLSGWHLSIFMCDLDAVTGMYHDESTREYHYEDVVGVETQRVGGGYAHQLPPEWAGAFLPTTPNGAQPAGVAPVLQGEYGQIVEITFLQLFRLLIKSGDRVQMVISATDREQVNYNAQNPTDTDRTIQRIQLELRDKKKGGVRRMPSLDED